MITFDFGYIDGTKAGQEIINNDLALNKEFRYQQDVMPYKYAYDAQRFKIDGELDQLRRRNEIQSLDHAFELNPWKHRNNIQDAELQFDVAPTTAQAAIAKNNASIVGNTNQAIKFDAERLNIPGNVARKQSLFEAQNKGEVAKATLIAMQGEEALKHYRDLENFRVAQQALDNTQAWIKLGAQQQFTYGGGFALQSAVEAQNANTRAHEAYHDAVTQGILVDAGADDASRARVANMQSSILATVDQGLKSGTMSPENAIENLARAFPEFEFRMFGNDPIAINKITGEGVPLPQFMIYANTNIVSTLNRIQQKNLSSEQIKQLAEDHSKVVDKALGIVSKLVTGKQEVGVEEVVKAVVGDIDKEALDKAGGVDGVMSQLQLPSGQKMNPEQAMAFAKQLIASFSPYRSVDIAPVAFPTPTVQRGSDGKLYPLEQLELAATPGFAVWQSNPPPPPQEVTSLATPVQLVPISYPGVPLNLQQLAAEQEEQRFRQAVSRLLAAPPPPVVGQTPNPIPQATAPLRLNPHNRRMERK